MNDYLYLLISFRGLTWILTRETTEYNFYFGVNVEFCDVLYLDVLEKPTRKEIFELGEVLY